MVGRIRDTKIERFLWCKEWIAVSEREHTKSPCVEKLEKELGWIIQRESENAANTQFGDDEELEKRILEKVGEILHQK